MIFKLVRWLRKWQRRRMIRNFRRDTGKQFARFADDQIEKALFGDNLE